MNRILNSLSIILFLTAVCPLWGQTSVSEIYANPGATGGVYYVYQEPSKAPTPAPKGYEAFYISHYGRHGSRYLIGDEDYLNVITPLETACSKGELTPLGEDVLARMRIIFEDARGRGGSLSSLGVKQHRGIAERMVANHPGLFDGYVDISARSTTVVRCVLSMEAFCERLKEINPKLNITRESCDRYMSYLNWHTPESNRFTSHDGPWYIEHKKFEKEHIHPDRLISSLFKNEKYVRQNIVPEDLMYALFYVASDLQDVELDGMSLYDIFEPQELFDMWQIGNNHNYICDGPSPLSQGLTLANAGTLVQNIIDSADEVIASGKKSATLRFGHDGNVIPLAGLLHLGECYGEETDPDKIYTVWSNFKITPMAANIQISFFRNKKDNNDIIVRFMLNEVEKPIPVETDIYPFYHWKDVRQYYKGILSSIGLE